MTEAYFLQFWSHQRQQMSKNTVDTPPDSSAAPLITLPTVVVETPTVSIPTFESITDPKLRLQQSTQMQKTVNEWWEMANHLQKSSDGSIDRGLFVVFFIKVLSVLDTEFFESGLAVQHISVPHITALSFPVSHNHMHVRLLKAAWDKASAADKADNLNESDFKTCCVDMILGTVRVPMLFCFFITLIC